MSPTGPFVTISLSRIRDNARAIAASTRVPVMAVVKADAYGLGAPRVVAALADLPEVEGFYTFTLAEALAAQIPQLTKKPTLALEPHPSDNVDDYLANRVRPSVWSADAAAMLRRATPVLSIDTGMQRFAAPADQAAAIVRAGDIREAMTHATRLEHVRQLKQATAGLNLRLHAAGSALLSEPEAALDATRPGLALYAGAVRVTSRLVDARDSAGPAGYTGFLTARHGVILGGYANGIRRGSCLVNGRPSRLLEVGMQTSFVELDPADKPGDEVTLLGDSLTAEAVAQSWSASPHEVLVRLSSAAPRQYVD